MSDPAELDRLASLYRQVACSTPSVSGAQFLPATTGAIVRVDLSSRDVDADATRTLEALCVSPAPGGPFQSLQTVPSERAGRKLASLSPSRRLLAVLEVDSSGPASGAPQYWFRVYSGSRIVVSLSTKGIHGEVHGDMMGGIAWAPDESAVVYVAEQKQPDAPGLYDVRDPAKAGKEKEAPRGRKYDFQNNLGEEMTKVSRPGLFVAKLADRKIRAVSGLGKPGWMLGQPCFDPDSRGLVCVAWDMDARVLGLRHYNTRRSWLVYAAELVLDGAADTAAAAAGAEGAAGSAAAPAPAGAESAKKVTEWRELTGADPREHSAMCPRFAPDGRQLAFVSTDPVNLHSSCSRLLSLSWPASASSVPRVLVDVVSVPTSADSFPGLWPASGGIGLLPSDVWLGDCRHLVLDSVTRSRVALFVVDTRDGSLAEIAPPADLGPLASMSVLDVRDDRVLVSAGAINRPAAVYTCSPLEKSGWTLVYDPAATVGPGYGPEEAEYRRACAQVAELRYEIVRVSPTQNPAAAGGLDFEAILVLPGPSSAPAGGAAPPPLVVFPHGGPHSTDTTQFWGGLAFLACAGSAVLLINYRGSRGFGQAALETLPGRCGQQDVQDVLDAVQTVLRSRPGSVDPARLRVTGGSHGGFLTLHLVGQQPDMFQAAVSRNPACNVAHMAASTDITDWCFAECGLPYDPRHVATAEEYSVMFAMSPISLVERVKTPVMIQLGDEDKRVPWSQGLDYMRTLRARPGAPPSRLLVYPGSNHGLRTKLSYEADGWVNAAFWLGGGYADAS